MRHIKKQTEPRELKEYRNGGGKWNDFSLDKGKRVVKTQIRKEQGGLCAYCTRSITFENMKVEHWYPQDAPEDRDLDYNNLLGTCQGNLGGHSHCDTSKANTVITLNPTNKGHINTISYGKASGSINSSNPIFQKELDDKLKLNLNINLLKKARKTRLFEFRKYLRKKYRNKKPNHQKYLKKWRTIDVPYNMVVVKYLENKIR